MNARSLRTRVRFASILALALLLSVFPTVVAAPGDLDPSFSGDGMIITRIGTGFWTGAGSSVAIQPDGKIVVAGHASTRSDSDFALVRYLPDGSLDPSFGSGGTVMTDFAAANDAASGLALQTDGKIVVAGTAWNGSSRDFALARYNADGTLDITFDGDGKVMTAIGSADDRGYDIALQMDGKIVVAGNAHNGTDSDFAVARYNVDGSLDNTFSGDGKIVTAIGSADDELSSVAIQSDQKIVVAGRTGHGTNEDVALARYEADGSLDASFGNNGIVVSSIISRDDGADDMVLQPDQRIVVVATTWNGADNAIAVARFITDGSLDSSFGADGKAESTHMTLAAGVALQTNGWIVVAGSYYHWGSTGDDFAFVRFNADGSVVDHTSTPIASNGNADYGRDVAIQSDGRIVIAGAIRPESGSGWDGFAVARYLGDPAPPVLKTYLPLILR